MAPGTEDPAPAAGTPPVAGGSRPAGGPAAFERLVALEGAYNFRDLGGYPVAGGRHTAWRRFFRSDTLSELTGADLAVLRQLGIASVIDLRTPAETEHDGRVALDGDGVRYVNLSILRPERGESRAAPPADVVARYHSYIEGDPPVVAAAIEEMVRAAGRPLVFHCTAGKDRTGVLAALVLALGGVDREHIVADYCETARHMPRILERVRRHPVYGRNLDRVPETRFAAEASTMERFLDDLDERYGGAEGWARRAGLGPQVVAGLRELLVASSAG